MKTTLSILLTSFSLISFSAAAQQTNAVNEKTSPKEFSIPASPVFDLMGVSPAQVTNLSDIKDFKVDWSFKSWKVSPNLALQAQQAQPGEIQEGNAANAAPFYPGCIYRYGPK